MCWPLYHTHSVLSPLQTDKSMLHSTSMATVPFPHTYALSSSLLSHPTVTFISLYSSPFYHNVCVKHLQLCQGRLWKNGDKKWDRDILETHRSRGRVSPTPLVPSMLWSLPRGRRQDDQNLYSMAKLFSMYFTNISFGIMGYVTPSFLFDTFFWQAADLTLKHSVWHDSSVS